MAAVMWLLLHGVLAAGAPIGQTQTLVAPWALRGLEERVRAAPAADDLHDLAELWARIAEDEEQKALAAHVAAFDACFDARRGDCEALAPVLSGALEAWRHTEVRSRQLLRDFPDSDHVPDAVVRLAWAWHRRGAHDLASAAFTWAGASQGDQRAWVMAGNIAFTAYDHDAALLAYQQAASVEGQLTAWALHRQAWTQHRIGETGRAIDTLKQLVAREATLDPHGLRDQALVDLVRFFADAGELYDLGGGALDSSLLQRLAAAYDDQGRHTAAIAVRRRLLATLTPDTAAAAAQQRAIIESTAALGDPSAVLAEAQRLRAQHPVHTAAHDDRLAYLIFDSARTLHERALREEDGAQLAALVALYDWHLEQLDACDHEVRFWRASALQSLGRLPEAAAAYADVVAREANGRYTRVAAARAQALAKP